MSKKILITGGNGDIARKAKTLLEQEGFQVFAPGREELDVTNAENVWEVVTAYQPDILINNAGFITMRPVAEADPQTTARHFDVNLKGTFFCTEAGLSVNPDLQIINIGSAVSLRSLPSWSEYGATKAAIAMATKCWAEEGLYAVCLAPGRTQSKMRKGLFPDEDQDTLLRAEDFAKVIVMAVRQEFESGTQVIVRKNTVERIIAGEYQAVREEEGATLWPQ